MAYQNSREQLSRRVLELSEEIFGLISGTESLFRTAGH
jgi:hypothetical protein